jgi:TRAP-type mannitol/chloroaromatic compound transport system permease large subunit
MPLLTDVVPLLTIFAVMMGSMYAGWAAPTDSAALGCMATLLLAAAFRVLSFDMVFASLRSTAIVTTMLFFIIAASTTFAQILAISGATDGALSALAQLELTPTMAVLAMVGVLLVLGCFMEQIAMMLLTLPFFVPLANTLNIDMLWLSIILLIALQVGLLSPPFGMLLFVMRGVVPPEVTTRQIWVSVVPFVLIVLAVLGLIILFPQVAIGLA